jgi:hypothetical protein
MKDKLKHLLFYALITIIFVPSIVWASPDEWTDKMPIDEYHNVVYLNKRIAQVTCVYNDAIGSCSKDNGVELPVSCGDKKFDVKDYIGNKNVTIIIMYYSKIAYYATGASPSGEEYYMCIDGKEKGKPHCWAIDALQKNMIEEENKYSNWELSQFDLYHGYKPIEFTEKEYMEKVTKDGDGPDIWKKCDSGGWSHFYLSDPGDGQLLSKNCNHQEFNASAPDLIQSTCSTLFGSPKDKNAPAYFLSFAFKVVRFVAIILLIVLSALDFLQAAASQDNDEIKKSFSKTMKRMVLCILIFVLPILLEFVLSIVNEKEVDLCISTSTEEGYVSSSNDENNSK